MVCPECGAPDDQGCRKGCPEVTRMTKDEALSKDDMLAALRKSVQLLSSTTILMKDGERFDLIDRQDVLQLITKYFRS